MRSRHLISNTNFTAEWGVFIRGNEMSGKSIWGARKVRKVLLKLSSSIGYHPPWFSETLVNPLNNNWYWSLWHRIGSSQAKPSALLIIDSRFKIQEFYWHNSDRCKFHQRNTRKTIQTCIQLTQQRQPKNHGYTMIHNEYWLQIPMYLCLIILS